MRCPAISASTWRRPSPHRRSPRRCPGRTRPSRPGPSRRATPTGWRPLGRSLRASRSRRSWSRGLLDAAAKAPAAQRAGPQAAALIVAAYAGASGPDLRGRLAALAVPEGRAPAGRNLALAAAAQERLVGETAMLVLWTCADAGAAGPAPGDRARSVQALREAGLDADARNFAVEGLLVAP
ncbi:hypothetical protein [Phenylobacterium sp. LjRoot219]|uniref:hypothetical protein n=1 Tax=Phenylobacterium sp. LjRoot219 TaxID=3342283 RepID=UPI003F50B68E